MPSPNSSHTGLTVSVRNLSNAADSSIDPIHCFTRRESSLGQPAIISLHASTWALFILLLCVVAVSIRGWVAMTKLVTMVSVAQAPPYGYPQPWAVAHTCLSKALFELGCA